MQKDSTKIVNGKQCTIFGYVDYNKISHVGQSVLEDILDKLKVQFGELIINSGNTHNFLRMNIAIRNNDKFEVDQVEHLQRSIEIIGEDVLKKVSSVSSADIYKIDESPKQLSEKNPPLCYCKVIICYAKR